MELKLDTNAMTKTEQEFENLLKEHLKSFENPKKLSKNTKKKYWSAVKTLCTDKGGKIRSASKYAKQQNLTYRQFTFYRCALMQYFVAKMLDAKNSKNIESLKRSIKIYKLVKKDFYKPEQKNDPVVDKNSKHFERVLRGLKNSNHQRKIPLNDEELQQLAEKRIVDRQAKEQKKRKTKSRSLAGLPDTWQDKVREQLPEKWQYGALVVEATGCRPIEIIHKPVKITCNKNIGIITVKIYGAKISVDRTHGQEWRSIDFGDDSDSFYKLLDLCRKEEKTEIEYQLAEKVNTFQQAYRRAAIKSGYKGVSLYSNRHYMGCKLKTEGQSMEQIAMVLGHQATSSTQKYGYIKKNSKGAYVPTSGVVGVSASSNVRVNHKVPAHARAGFAPSPN